MVIALILALFISQDANPVQAWHIAKRGYAHTQHPIRTIDNRPPYAYFHQDLQSPSYYVKERLSNNDLVIVIGGPHQLNIVYWYIGRVDYYIQPSDGPHFYSIVRDGKEINYTTGCGLIYSISQLEDLLQNTSGSIWLIGDKALLSNGLFIYSESYVKYFNSIIKQFDFVGHDNMTIVAQLK